MLKRLGSVFMLGLAMIVAGPARLLAATQMEELQKRVTNTSPSGDDGLLFHTADSNVLVLADNDGNIGAILICGKGKNDKVKELTDKLISLVNSKERPDVRYGRDESTALVLYTETAKQMADTEKEIAYVPRLTAVYNICTRISTEWRPSRWHGGGVTFRLYRGGRQLAAEVVLDLTEESVPYGEIRIKPRFDKIRAVDLAAHDYGVPDNKQHLRRLSDQLGDAKPLSSNSDNDTHVSERFGVYCIGHAERHNAAHLTRRDSHGNKEAKSEVYVFPLFEFPEKEATLKEPGAIDEKVAANLRGSTQGGFTLPQLHSALPNGAPTGKHLISWKTRDCGIMALAEKKDELGLIIVHPSNNTARDSGQAQKTAQSLQKAFCSRKHNPAIFDADEGKGNLLMYPGTVADTFLVGEDLPTVVRTLFAKGRRCTDIALHLPHLKLTFDAGLNEKLTFILDLSSPRADKIHVLPSDFTPRLEKLICAMLNLKKPTTLSAKDQVKINEAMNGKVMYAERGPNIFLSIGNKSRYFTAGKLRHVKESNGFSPRTFPKFAEISLPSRETDLPGHHIDPDTTPHQDNETQSDSTERKPYTPKQARDAYIDYLNKI